MKSTITPLKFQPKEDVAFSPIILAEVPVAVLDMPESSLQQKVLKVVAVLKWAMARFEICFSYSGGKDSSTVLSMGLAAAAQLTAEGIPVKRFLVLNSDTQVENPEVLGVVQSELNHIRNWIREHNLPGNVQVTEPYLLSQWSVNIIGGKSLVSTPITNRNCTTDLKSSALNRARVSFFGRNQTAKGKFTVGVTGVRFSESAERAGNMLKRAESPVQVVQTNADGDVFLAPIANWTTDEVMEFIGLAVNHDVLDPDERLPVQLYSDFVEVWRIYKDAEGECSVGRGDNKPSAGCGARHGCYVCLQVTNDKSMDALLTQEQYSYMAPLSRLREYLGNTVMDFSKRIWISRSIKDGHVGYGPDAYSPEYVQDLLRFSLTIDRNEQLDAAKLGIKPRFRIVSMRALFAIDALWSLQAFALPFAALKIYHDVYVKGLSFEVPTVAKVPKTPMPPPRFIPVEDWDEDAHGDYTGLRSVLLEATEGPCTVTREITVKGVPRQVMDVNVGQMFDVHEESIEMLMLFELDGLVARYHEAERSLSTRGFSLVGEGYRFYAMYGAITIAKSSVGEIDSIMRRSNWRERHNLAGYNYDQAKAFAMSLAKPLPVEERKQPYRPSDAEIKAYDRRCRRGAVNERRIPLDVLFREWSPSVAWHRMAKQGLPVKRLLAHCLQKQNKKYNAGYRKGWAIHHFVSQGDLVRFLKETPHVAAQVKNHRAYAKRPGRQLDMF